MITDSNIKRRILKTLAALLGRQGIQLLTQLLLPPVFIMAYGVEGYAEWLVLSAAVGYLTTLDFGLQNYVPNQLTMLFHQGKLDDCRQLQSVGLRIMAGFLGFGTLASSWVFVLPVDRWLGLSLPPAEVSLCLFLLALQILFSIAYGQVNATFRAFGAAHRGVMWANTQRIGWLLATVICARAGSRFSTIALAQVVVVLAATVLVLRDLRRQQPDLVPTWGRWDGALGRTVIRQSGFFALFTLNNFLLYQLPVLAINRVLGGVEVVAFSVTRMLFSTSRQLTVMAHGTLAPEMSRLYALGDQERLGRLYRSMESVVLSVVWIASIALLLGAPALLQLWLGKPELFDPGLFILMMSVSAVISVKDYKLYLQYATNVHRRAARLTSVSNAVLCLALLPVLTLAGLRGLLGLWLVTELIQLAWIHRYNHALLGGARANSFRPALLLALGLGTATVQVIAFDLFWWNSRDFLAFLRAAIAVLACGGFAWIMFDLKAVLRLFLGGSGLRRLRSRHRPVAS